jgi:hypothetical protein
MYVQAPLVGFGTSYRVTVDEADLAASHQLSPRAGVLDDTPRPAKSDRVIVE